MLKLQVLKKKKSNDLGWKKISWWQLGEELMTQDYLKETPFVTANC